MVKRKIKKWQTMNNKTQHGKLKTEQHEVRYKPRLKFEGHSELVGPYWIFPV